MHDPRIGRFFAVDPLAGKYPFYSPYSFSGNKVIDAIELEGLEPVTVHAPDGNIYIVGYLVQAGQGPTQIAKDINSYESAEEYGYKLHSTVQWQDIVTNNPKYFPDDISRYADDERYTELNMNEGDPLVLPSILKQELNANAKDRYNVKIEVANEKIEANNNAINKTKESIKSLKNSKKNIYDRMDFEKKHVLKDATEHGAKTGYGQYEQRKWGTTLGNLQRKITENQNRLKKLEKKAAVLQGELKEIADPVVIK